MNIKIVETNNEIYVYFPYDNKLIEKVKTLYPCRWDKEQRAWCYPVSLKEEVYNLFNIYKPESNHKTKMIAPGFLLSHQKECLKIAEKKTKFGFYLDTGTGKTLLALTILWNLKSKSIIVAPLSTLQTVWEEQIQRWYSDMKYINLYPYKKSERELIILKDNSIHIINYEAFKIHYEVIKKAGYKCLIVDESSKLKGRTTDIAKTIIDFSNYVEYCYLFSGNPAPNNKMEFYPQIQAIAPNLLGYSFYAFRNRYFYPADRMGYVWVEKKEMQKEFIDRLKKVCIFIKKSDIIDLPEKSYIVKTIEMDPEQKTLYRKLKRDYALQIGDIKVITPTVLSMIAKLRQITSGFIYHSEGVYKFSNSKLDILKETLEEIGNNQVIIWTNFREETERLAKEIKNSLPVYGELSQKEKNNNIEAFKKGDIQYLVANQASIAHGQNLINSSYSIYYSLDWSSELYTQSQDRIYRYGQKNKCTYIHLLCKDTIDEIIYKRLQKKIDGTLEVLNHLKQEV